MSIATIIFVICLGNWVAYNVAKFLLWRNGRIAEKSVGFEIVNFAVLILLLLGLIHSLHKTIPWLALSFPTVTLLLAVVWMIALLAYLIIESSSEQDADLKKRRSFLVLKYAVIFPLVIAVFPTISFLRHWIRDTFPGHPILESLPFLIVIGICFLIAKFRERENDQS